MPPLVPMGVSPFLSTPSVRRATIIGQVLTGTTSHFYPRPPRGGRRFIFHSEVCIWKFLSTPSARRATCQIPQTITLLQHFYPRPPRGGRHVHKRLVSDDWEFLSTPSARRATLPAGEQAAAMGISIHALREEGDLRISDALELKTAFLSTPSARRATKNPSFDVAVRINFYPRPPRGGRPGAVQGFVQDIEISIHALREEGDGCRFKSCKRHFIFLSTPSARRATPPHPAGRLERHISIHALREEGDPDPSGTNRKAPNFYPRPPRGGRPLCGPPAPSQSGISIHALREEGDTLWLTRRFKDADFYPRPPRGGRRVSKWTVLLPPTFLSTPSARRATKEPRSALEAEGISIHALREEGDADKVGGDVAEIMISIHALREEGDEEETQVFTDELAFLSTPSARRATYTSAWNELQEKNFYPRPPRGGRQLARNQSSASSTFLSTPSARRATKIIYFSLTDRSISIHALREEGDNMTSTTYSAIPGISIHALREEGDLNVARASGGHREFLSTPSARRATMGDGEAPAFVFLFLSTPSARRATRTGLRFDGENQSISIHALREEGDSRT